GRSMFIKYMDMDIKEKAVFDTVLIELCGYSFKTILDKTQNERVFRNIKVLDVFHNRLYKDDMLPGVHYYDIRHSDNNISEPATIEEQVTVNRLATIGLEEPLPIHEDDYIALNNEEKNIIMELI